MAPHGLQPLDVESAVRPPRAAPPAGAAGSPCRIFGLGVATGVLLCAGLGTFALLRADTLSTKFVGAAGGVLPLRPAVPLRGQTRAPWVSMGESSDPETPAAEAPTEAPAAAPAKKAPVARRSTNRGPFAPAVVAAKQVMGDKKLNELRADIIKKHTKVIAGFVDTSESKFGQLALKQMFEAADKDKSGALDRDEIRAALHDLGFADDDKNLDKVMSVADVDDNEVIDFEEFITNSPTVLRGNLIQTAKKNGADLGFLA